MFCPKCGYKANDNDSFCQMCGFALNSPNANNINFNDNGIAKKKKTKKAVICVIAVILTAAIVSAACVIIAPKVKENEKSDNKTNTSAETTETIKKDVNNDTYVASNGENIFAVMEDGTVQSTVFQYTTENGENDHDVQISYDVSSWENIKSIAVGENHVVGLKEDGTCVAELATYRAVDYEDNEQDDSYGNYDYGQCEVDGWKNITQICATPDGTVGLKEDGSLVYTGNEEEDFTSLFQESEWANICSIACYDSVYFVAVKNDGTVVSTDNYFDVSDWTDIKSVYTCGFSVIGITTDGKVVTTFGNSKNEKYLDETGDAFICVPAASDSGLKEIASWTDIERVFVTRTNYYSSDICDYYSFLVGIKSDGTTVAATIMEFTSDGEPNMDTYGLKSDEYIDKITDVSGIIGGCYYSSNIYDEYIGTLYANVFLTSDGKLEVYDPTFGFDTDYIDMSFKNWSNIKTNS